MYVIPDLRSLSRHGLTRGHPEASNGLFPGFRLVGRNDKSLRDNQILASPEGEGFQPSPKRTLTLYCLRRVPPLLVRFPF